MNAFVLLSLEESTAQRGARKHHLWRGYLTLLVVNHGVIQTISILTAVIPRMIKFDVDIPQDCFCLEVKCTLVIR